MVGVSTLDIVCYNTRRLIAVLIMNTSMNAISVAIMS
jgi:hypothetical protein